MKIICGETAKKNFKKRANYTNELIELNNSFDNLEKIQLIEYKIKKKDEKFIIEITNYDFYNQIPEIYEDLENINNRILNQNEVKKFLEEKRKKEKEEREKRRKEEKEREKERERIEKEEKDKERLEDTKKINYFLENFENEFTKKNIENIYISKNENLVVRFVNDKCKIFLILNIFHDMKNEYNIRSVMLDNNVNSLSLNLLSGELKKMCCDNLYRTIATLLKNKNNSDFYYDKDYTEYLEPRIWVMKIKFFDIDEKDLKIYFNCQLRDNLNKYDLYTFDYDYVYYDDNEDCYDGCDFISDY